MAKRDLQKEYRDYHGKPEQIARRAARNSARKAAEARGAVKKGDDKEVHHVNAPRLGKLDNKNVRVVSRKYNRSQQPKRGGKK